MKLLIKRISALVLAASFFLPLTQCSQKLGSSLPPDTMSAANAYEWPGIFSTFALLAFFWPLVIQFWRMMKGRRLPSRKVAWIEVALSGLSFVGISCLVLPWFLEFGVSISYGAVLAWASTLAYGAISLIDALKGRPSRAGPRIFT